MATPTLQDLLTPRDQPTIEATLLAVLQAANFPVTDWAPGGFERTHVKMTAAGLADRENLIQMLTAAGFLDMAATITDASGNLVEGWMEILAAQNFDNPRGQATFAQQMLTLTCTSGPGPYTRNPGEIVAYSPSTGNRYVNVNAVTIPDGGTVAALFQAQTAGAGYQDAAGSIIALITPMPGVSVNNPVTAGGVPTVSISGTGTASVTSTGITTTPRTIQLVWTTAGRVDDGSAQFTCTIYQGQSVATTGPFSVAAGYTSAAFVQGDVTLTLTDGPTSTQSFNAGDAWTVSVPGTPMVQSGSDKETLAQLNQECHDRWASLSDVPTVGRFEGWVFACSKAQGLGLTKVKASPSTDVAGWENIYIAGTSGTATSDQVTAVQAYINARVSEIEGGDVQAATAVAITPSGIVQCRRGTTAAVQVAADAAWLAYISAMPIGGSPPDGLVEIAELSDALINAGAYNALSLGFAGHATGADVSLAANAVATVGTPPSASMTWQEVA